MRSDKTSRNISGEIFAVFAIGTGKLLLLSVKSSAETYEFPSEHSLLHTPPAREAPAQRPQPAYRPGNLVHAYQSAEPVGRIAGSDTDPVHSHCLHGGLYSCAGPAPGLSRQKVADDARREHHASRLARAGTPQHAGIQRKYRADHGRAQPGHAQRHAGSRLALGEKRRHGGRHRRGLAAQGADGNPRQPVQPVRSRRGPKESAQRHGALRAGQRRRDGPVQPDRQPVRRIAGHDVQPAGDGRDGRNGHLGAMDSRRRVRAVRAARQ